MPTKVLTFNSMTELLDYNERMPVLTNGTSHEQGRERFSGTSTYEKASELVEGWHEGVEKIEHFARPVVDMISSKMERSDVFHDVEGMGIDVARFVEGEPECWQNYISTHVEGVGQRVLRLVLNGSTSGGINKEQMIERGSFVCATVDCLERAGFSVEVWYAFACRHYAYGNERWLSNINVKIKESNQPIDMARVAFALAHPAMLRRLLFATMERTPDIHKSSSSGYGLPTPSPLEQTADIAFPMHFLGEKFPPSRLLDILKKAGVVLHEEV